MWWLLLLTLPATSTGLPVIAIDPGHGGEQPGAVGVCGAIEKEIALSISLELGRLVEASGRATALLTRNRDTHLELEERTRIANQAEAALFISIHANASTRATRFGVEVYFLSRAGANRQVSELALRENDGREFISTEEVTALDQILRGLSLQASHAESQRFALEVQDNLETQLAAGGRGVLQEAFIVLLSAQMPAVLVEIGFLTNEQECQLLANTAYQRKIARALMTAVLAHLAAKTPLLAER